MLANIGWTAKEFRFEAFKPTVDPIGLRQLTVEAIASIAQGEALEVVERTICLRTAKLEI